MDKIRPLLLTKQIIGESTDPHDLIYQTNIMHNLRAGLFKILFMIHINYNIYEWRCADVFIKECE